MSSRILSVTLRVVALVSLFLCVVLVSAARAVTPHESTRVARVIKDVQILTSGVATMRASSNAELGEGTSIRTGVNSRVELALADGTLLRLGAKTTFTAPSATQLPALNDGAVLFAETNGNGAKIKTGGITAVLRGTTGIIDRLGNKYVKLLVLSGTARVYLNKIGESVLVEPGQMLITKPDAQTLPEPVNFDIEQLYKTSVLTSSDFTPLPSAQAIAREITRQKSDPEYVRTNLVIFGRGTLVNLIPPTPTPAAGKDSSAKNPKSSRTMAGKTP